MKLVSALVFVGTVASSFGQIDTVTARLQAVEASAQVSDSQITLVWPSKPDAAGYRIARKSGDSWQEVAVLGGGSTSWTDGNVSQGQRYEYRVTKETNRGYNGYSFVKAGIRAAALEDAGKVLILVADNIAGALGGEINQLKQNLILEGWQVVVQSVGTGAAVTQVKDLIRGQFNAGVRSVILLGHVPVPYSGDMFPDGHANHQGAWPADVYYAEMDGGWSDSSVNSKVSERQVNWNWPGDGKFDQSWLPSPVDIALGRVDLSDMTCYANKSPSRSEVDLMRAYLNKNSSFRRGEVQLQRRGMILDNFGLREGNGVSASGFRNFASFFGSQNIHVMDLNTYFPRMKNESALWSWGAGGGSYYYSSGIGSSDDFALNDVQIAFTLWLGSYYGDWNNESNWMRAALGSGRILVSIYSGLPHSFLHGMALGETVGQAVVLSQNNWTSDGYFPDGQGLGMVHQSMLGDPTLRMFPRGGLSGLNASGGNGKATLSWNGGGDGFAGVNIYRGSSAEGPFAKVAGPVGGSSHDDAVSAGTYSYLVRPVYLENTGSGSFYNLGIGSIAANVTVTGGGGGPIDPPPPPPPNPPGTMTLRAARQGENVGLSLTGTAGKGIVVEYTLDFSSWTFVASDVIPASGSLSYTVKLSTDTRVVYRGRYSGNP